MQCFLMHVRREGEVFSVGGCVRRQRRRQEECVNLVRHSAAFELGRGIVLMLGAVLRGVDWLAVDWSLFVLWPVLLLQSTGAQSRS